MAKLHVEHLTYVYESRSIGGVRNISFTFPEKKLIALTGPNGSGKTTLLKILAKKIQPQSGTVHLSGDVKYVSASLSLPANENVFDFLKKSISLHTEEAQKVQLVRDMAARFEFTSELKQKTCELSSGQSQRVALASILINRPTLLLLDEPFAHLDQKLRHELMILIKELVLERDLICLWVSHHLDEVCEYADEMLMMNYGHIEQKGSPHDLYLHPRNIFVAQFLGYQNLMTVKKVDNQKWSFPFGHIESELKTKSEEAVLVIPTYAVKLMMGEHQGKVVSCVSSGDRAKVCLQKNDVLIWSEIPLIYRDKISVGQKISFSIETNLCILVDCL